MMNLNDPYEFVWGESDSMLILESTLRSYIDTRNVIATEPHHVVITSQNRQARAFYRASDLRNAKSVAEHLCEEQVIHEYFSGSEKLEVEFQKFIREINNQGLKLLSNDELVACFKRYFELITIALAHYQASTVPEYLQVAHDKLAQKLSEEELRALIQPSELTTVELEEIRLIELSLQQEISDEEILSYIGEFSYMAWNNYDNAELIKYIREKLAQLREQSADDRQHRQEEIRQTKAKLSEKQREILERKNDAEIILLSGMIRDMGEWRFRIKKYWAGAEFLVQPLLIEISDRIKLDMTTLMWVYSRDEVISAILQKELLSETEVEKRKKSYTLVLDNEQIRLLTGKEEQNFLKKYIEIELDDVKELIGKPANRGIGRGRVKIVHVEDLNRLKQDEQKFRDGDVLVSTMTQVNVVPLMKRAAAILTEQGGITSHAAIVSRELNKPCIVGVKNLTRVLKDGDEIEVDAETGKVRIINKANP